MWYNHYRLKGKGGEGIIRAEQNKYHNTIVAIAASTGGPKILSDIISRLQKDLPFPVLVVQHMPEKFTQILAKRLSEKSEISVKEAHNGMQVLPGNVYVAQAGKHMQIRPCGDVHLISLTDEDYREGVKPCANYMFESLADCNYEDIYCIVLTGMGSDGTEGIEYLSTHKKIHIWIQEKESCVVYGMPGSITKTELEHETLSVEEIVNKINNI